MHLSVRPRHVSRYRQLAVLLAKYGGVDTLRSAGLSDYLDDGPVSDAGIAGDNGPGANAGDAAKGRALADELEQLGPTFVKLGQLLSSRSDLLPPAYVSALARLQDSCEPFPFSEVEATIQQELGVRMSRLFREFDDVPMAAASLGQVHRAVLRDGRVVAVKVQRPHIREMLSEDLDVLGELAEFFEAHSENARRFAVTEAFEQFRRALVAELDYRREAANLRTLHEVLAGRERIVVPLPYDDFTTSRVLTMDFVDGRKVLDLAGLARIDLDGPMLADEVFGAYLDQILRAGFFHADPHPGNVLVTPDQRIAFVDVGMVGRLSPDTRRILGKLIVAIMSGRSAEVVRVARSLGTPQDDFDPAALQVAVDDLMATVTQNTLADIDVARTFIELSRRCADAGLRLAPEFTMLGKTLLNLEHVAAELDPSFDPMAAFDRHLPGLVRDQMGTSGGLLSSLLEAKEFAEELPGRVNRAMDALGAGHFELRVHAFDETQFLRGLHRLANVCAAGLIVAALIVGSALLANRPGGSHVVSNSIAIGVFALAAVASLALLGWMAWASRKVRARNR
jgi:ubiquinone biosynthesis protein